MSKQLTRNVISVIAVAVILLFAAVCVFIPLAMQTGGSSQPSFEAFKTWSGAFSGVLGTIFGYYFGQQSQPAAARGTEPKQNER